MLIVLLCLDFRADFGRTFYFCFNGIVEPLQCSRKVEVLERGYLQNFLETTLPLIRILFESDPNEASEIL